MKQVVDVPRPGHAVRFDYQSLDASHGHLYVAHMNADQLVVFTKKRQVVANVDGFPGEFHCSLAYSALASFRMGMSGSAKAELSSVGQRCFITRDLVRNPEPLPGALVRFARSLQTSLPAGLAWADSQGYPQNTDS